VASQAAPRRSGPAWRRAGRGSSQRRSASPGPCCTTPGPVHRQLCRHPQTMARRPEDRDMPEAKKRRWPPGLGLPNAKPASRAARLTSMRGERSRAAAQTRGVVIPRSSRPHLSCRQSRSAVIAAGVAQTGTGRDPSAGQPRGEAWPLSPARVKRCGIRLPQVPKTGRTARKPAGLLGSVGDDPHPPHGCRKTVCRSALSGSGSIIASIGPSPRPLSGK
jgi:hypothetical protein